MPQVIQYMNVNFLTFYPNLVKCIFSIQLLFRVIDLLGICYLFHTYIACIPVYL